MDSAVLYPQLMRAALRFVSLRKRSTKEVREYLQKRLKTATLDVQTQLVHQVTVRLSEMGYTDDLAFARWWVEARRRTKPKGFSAIERELAEKGISREIVSQVVSEALESGKSEFELAKESVQRILGRWRALEGPKRVQKAYQWLLRRGFSSNVAEQVARTIDRDPQVEYTPL